MRREMTGADMCAYRRNKEAWAQREREAAKAEHEARQASRTPKPVDVPRMTRVAGIDLANIMMGSVLGAVTPKDRKNLRRANSQRGQS
jgi:hypothetical protein